MSFYRLLQGICLVYACFISESLFANDTIYEQRRQAYIDSFATRTDSDAMCLQAYTTGTVDTNMINNIVNSIPTKSTIDFDIVKLIRVLYLTNGAYESKILPALNTVPFWLTKGDTLRGYWSENHMIMWMSSDWLLHEKYGRPIDAGLDNRLRHYLRLKVKYGFYEFFSSVYAPYCLSGLLNLADFAQDPEIKSLATQASVKLLRSLLLVTNDKGVMLAVAGRNYYGKYDTPYNQNHNNLIYLLTGMGERPTSASHCGAFLATSTLQVDSITSSWVPQLDILYHIGHTLDSGLIHNAGQRPVDKVIFQWSSGAYFHPAVVQETAQLLEDSLIWGHVDFEPLSLLRGFSVSQLVNIANNLSAISKSSVSCGQDVAIFKHNSVTLTSIQDFWKGKAGYQQYPCIANVGTTPVYTASGVVKKNWYDRGANTANEHLPYVTQKSNVALLMYRPEPYNVVLKSADVALHFRPADFDEVRTDSLWLLGRQENGYVAVRRSCIGEIDSVPACPTVGGQSWVIVVGDSMMYGSFNNFADAIHQAAFTEEWYYDSLTEQSVYYASITLDTINLEYAWGVDSVATSIRDISGNPQFRMYPNPANDKVTIELPLENKQPAHLKALNLMGQIVYEAAFEEAQHQISTANWPVGIYMISIEQGNERYLQRLIKVD